MPHGQSRLTATRNKNATGKKLTTVPSILPPRRLFLQRPLNAWNSTHQRWFTPKMSERNFTHIHFQRKLPNSKILIRPTYCKRISASHCCGSGLTQSKKNLPSSRYKWWREATTRTITVFRYKHRAAASKFEPRLNTIRSQLNSVDR